MACGQEKPTPHREVWTLPDPGIDSGRGRAGPEEAMPKDPRPVALLTPPEELRSSTRVRLIAPQQREDPGQPWQGLLWPMLLPVSGQSDERRDRLGVGFLAAPPASLQVQDVDLAGRVHDEVGGMEIPMLESGFMEGRQRLTHPAKESNVDLTCHEGLEEGLPVDADRDDRQSVAEEAPLASTQDRTWDPDSRPGECLTVRDLAAETRGAPVSMAQETAEEPAVAEIPVVDRSAIRPAHTVGAPAAQLQGFTTGLIAWIRESLGQDPWLLGPEDPDPARNGRPGGRIGGIGG